MFKLKYLLKVLNWPPHPQTSIYIPNIRNSYIFYYIKLCCEKNLYMQSQKIRKENHIEIQNNFLNRFRLSDSLYAQQIGYSTKAFII